MRSNRGPNLRPIKTTVQSAVTPLAGYLLVGVGISLLFSALALLIGLIWGVGLIVRGAANGTALKEIFVGIPLVILAYLVAGILSGVALWLIQRLRPAPLRHAMSGVLVAGAAYGAVGLASVLAYDFIGVNMMNYTSREEAWAGLLPTTLMLALVAGIPGGLWFGYSKPWG